MESDNKPCLISVVMAVYNSDRYKLSRAIKSILNQSFSDFELIICDNNSNNGTFEYLESIKDNRIVLLKNDINRGQTFSLNRCLSVAKGKYIARMDDDDISAKDRFKYQVLFLEKNPEIGIVGTGIWLIDEDIVWGEDLLVEKPVKKDLLRGVVHAHPSIMVRKEVYDLVNNYRDLEKVGYSQDYDFYMRVYAKGIKGYNIQKKLLFYNLPPNANSKRKFITRVGEARVMYEGFRQLKLLPLGLIYVFKPIIAWLLPNKLKQKRLNVLNNSYDKGKNIYDFEELDFDYEQLF